MIWLQPRFPHCTGSDITIWISGTRESTSLLPPLILVSHHPCSKTHPNGIQTHDYSHTKQASYHMTTQCTLCCSLIRLALSITGKYLGAYLEAYLGACRARLKNVDLCPRSITQQQSYLSGNNDQRCTGRNAKVWYIDTSQPNWLMIIMIKSWSVTMICHKKSLKDHEMTTLESWP